MTVEDETKPSVGRTCSVLCVQVDKEAVLCRFSSGRALKAWRR